MELDKLEIRATPLACGCFGTMRDHAALPKARSGNRGCRGGVHPPATMIDAVVDGRDFIAAMQPATCSPEDSTVVVAGGILNSTPDIRSSWLGSHYPRPIGFIGINQALAIAALAAALSRKWCSSRNAISEISRRVQT